MILRKINAPSEHIGIDGAGLAFKLAGDYFHPVAPAEPVVKTHALEGISLVRFGSGITCHLMAELLTT